MWKQLLRRAALIGGISLLILIVLLTVGQTEVQAQPPDCSDVIDTLFGVIQDQCAVVGPGNACYASDRVRASPVSAGFTRPGRIVPFRDLTSLRTYANTGAAILVAGTNQGPVKIMAMGGAQVASSSHQVFTLRKTNEGLVCDKTPSGLLLQTPGGRRGQVTINGVSIELGSTALVTAEGEVLFDQDPRIDRRQGHRNPNAPLCSGFDSQCDFGDSHCPLGERLVWGPYCREDVYPNISPGLYRMTLYGEGRVRAGATDYNVTHKTFAYGFHNLTLPADYTFCWPGIQPGGTGFETIVQSRSSNARVDRITLEYLGPDCDAGAAAGLPSMMTVANVEGEVTVRAAGAVRQLAPGTAVRVLYKGDEPVAVEQPHSAGAIMASPLIEWLTFDPGGMPRVDRGEEYSPPASEPTEPTSPTDPEAWFAQVGVSGEDYYGESEGLVLEVAALDPGVGDYNGAGIDSVRFRIFAPDGKLVFERTERRPAYCAFGGDGPCTPFIFAENDNYWPSGAYISGGRYAIEARARTKAGAETTIRTRIDLQPQQESSPPADDVGPDLAGVTFDPVWEDGRLCMYKPITVWASAYDDSGVESMTFYYRFHPEGSSPTLWVTAPMDQIDDNTFTTQFSELDSGQVEYTVVAMDGAGNQSQSPYQTVDTIVCVQVD